MSLYLTFLLLVLACYSSERELNYTLIAVAVFSLHARLRRWTSKEAIYKALHPYYTPTWKEISILKLPGSSKPHVVFEPIGGEVGERERWKEQYRFHLSVSHDGEYVVANVVVEEI